MMTEIFFAGAVFAAALAAAMFIFALYSRARPPEPLFGESARKRRQALSNSRLLRTAMPLIDLLGSIDTVVGSQRYRAWVARSLIHAGSPAGMRVHEFMGLNVLAVLVGVGFGLYGSLMVVGEVIFGLLFLGAVFGAILPSSWLSQRVDLRLKDANRGLPYAINVIVLAMEAGLDFTSAVQRYVTLGERRVDVLREELEIVLSELGLGRTRREALEAMAQRLPSETVRGVVVAAVQADKLGTPLTKTLREQMQVVQTRRIQTAEKKAAESSVKILAPLMFIFAAVFLVLFSSIILRGCSGGLP